MNINFKRDTDSGFLLLGNQPVILHCHHYNVTLQETILMPDYIDGFGIQYKAAAETAWEALSGLENTGSPEQVFSAAKELYRIMGLGTLDFEAVDENGGKIKFPTSHYKIGYAEKVGQVSETTFVFSAGYLSGVFAFAYKKTYNVTIKREAGIFLASVEKASDNLPDFKTVDYNTGRIKNLSEENLGHEGNTNVNTDAVGAFFRDNPPQAGEDGLIKAFGVYLTYLPANYYNKISYRFEKILDDAGGIEGLAKPLLVEAGHICGFSTFGGIMTSETWKENVGPALKTKEDWVYAMVSAINTFGWGYWQILEVDPGKKLRVKVLNSVEGIGFHSEFGEASETKCFMAEGTASAVMNLIYLGGLESNPVFDDDFYYTLFSSKDSFVAEETLCAAKGDDYCEITVAV